MWVADSDSARQIGPECTWSATLYSIPGGAIKREKEFALVDTSNPPLDNSATRRDTNTGTADSETICRVL